MAGTKYLAGGAWVKVMIKNASGVMEQIGLATNVTYDEDFQIQPANVLNYLGPIDYDSQGYSCNITMGTFVPENIGGSPINASQGSIDLISLLSTVTRTSVQTDNGKPGEFGVLSFESTSASGIAGSTKGVLASFERVMVASHGVQISPNSYVTANIRFMAISRTA